MRNKEFHQKLKKLMDEFVNLVYDVTGNFPKNEIFGLTSQYRRSALSVILNYIEGYARQNRKIMKNFFEISYGSLKEAKYLTYFSKRREYLSEEKYQTLINLAEEIGAILWTILVKM